MNEERMNRRLRRMSRFVIIVGLLLLITGILFVSFLLNIMKDAALDQMRVETQEYNKRLYDQIDADYQIINTFASIVGASDLSNDPEFPEMLNDANYQNDFLTMIYADQQGNAVAATLDMGFTEGIHLSDAQPEVQSVLRKALQGEESMSQLFHGAISNEAVFVYGTPVYKGDEITGAVAASDKVEIFSEILNGEGVLGGYGYINMINMDGDYIVHSEKDQIGKALDNVFSEPYFESDEVEKAKQELQENGELTFSFRFDGNRYEAIIQPVGINNWCLLSIGDVHTSSRQVYMLVRIIGSVFAVILILVLFLLIYNCRTMRESSRELKKIAYRDALTGVCNLIGFRKQVEKQIFSDKNYSIIALNVHQFRFINEIFGKEQGDRILCKVAQTIRSEMSDGDIVCRESADIFYVYTKETDKKAIENRFKKIMNSITSAACEGHGDYEILLYCGATVNIEGPGECTFDEMMAHVMTAVRTAKDIHQNNIWFFDKELHRKEMLWHYVETHMNQAMRDREFYLYLQPKVSLETDKVAGAEALVRWIKADGEIIYPDQFIPLFESNGFCVQLDIYMVEMVCRQIREWMDNGLQPVPVSVNQSKRVMYEKEYLKKLHTILDKYHVPAELITLEILEGLAIENADEINRKIEELQEKGFRVSLDDFGTEYSSFSTFSRLQVDELKLDRSFLKDMNETGNLKIELIMEKIVQIARRLNIKTVVEGVETEEDHNLIKKINCDYGQGYHYSRPVSAEEFTRMFLKE